LDNTKLGTTLSSSFDNAVTMLSANRENQSIYSTLDGGIAGNAVRKITAMLASTAAISTNSANATTNIEKYKKDLVTLEARMSKLKERYLKQFAAMDSIVGQSTTMRTSMQATYDGMMATYTNK
jgi:flagellar hook-associated protein 2